MRTPDLGCRLRLVRTSYTPEWMRPGMRPGMGLGKTLLPLLPSLLLSLAPVVLEGGVPQSALVPQPPQGPSDLGSGGGDSGGVSSPILGRSSSYRCNQACATQRSVPGYSLACLICLSTQVSLHNSLSFSLAPEGQGSPTPFELYTSIIQHCNGSCHDRIR